MAWTTLKPPPIGRRGAEERPTALIRSSLGTTSLEYALLFSLLLVPTVTLWTSLGENLAQSFAKNAPATAAVLHPASDPLAQSLAIPAPSAIAVNQAGSSVFNGPPRTLSSDPAAEPSSEADGAGPGREDSPPAPPTSSSTPRKLGTAGKVAVVATSAVATAGVGFATVAATSYGSSLLCGPAAAACAGVVTVGLGAWGLWTLTDGGLTTIKNAWGRVFSAEDATVEDAVTVGGVLSTVVGGGSGQRLTTTVSRGIKSLLGRKPATPKASTRPATTERQCFAAGTVVYTAAGPVPIERIRRGQEVWSRDTDTGAVALRPVRRTFKTPERPLLLLIVRQPSGEQEPIAVTEEHPFWTREEGWTAAGRLQPGRDHLLSLAGSWLEVVSVDPAPQRATVYNLEVAEHHTYFAGKGGALVHNDCNGGEGSGELGSRGGKRTPTDADRVRQQQERRVARRERQSREQNGQSQSGQGFRDTASAKKGPGGVRPSRPGTRNTRERNRGIDEEHSMKPKGQQSF